MTATPQTIQAIHSHIFALPDETESFKEFYKTEPQDEGEQRLNNKARDLRLTMADLAFQSILHDELQVTHPELEVHNEGRWVSCDLDNTNLSSQANCRKIAQLTGAAECSSSVLGNRS